MAYIVSTLQTATQATGTTYAVNFPSGVLENDLLLVKLSQDGSVASLGVSASGFTALGTQTISGASSSQWFFKIAAGGETTATFACANDDIIATTLLIRDAHATAPFGASPTSAVNYIRTDWNNVSSTGCGALTPPEDECLLIYSWNADGSNQYMRCKLNEVTAADKYATTVINHIIGYRQQQTAASTAGSATMYNINATEGGNGWVLAVRNKSGGALQPDIRPDITELKWHGSWEAPHDSITWQAPSNFAATINSITCSSTGPTTSITNSQPQTTWGVSTGLASSENTAGSWVGGTFTISSTDMTGKIAALQYSVSAASTSSLSGSDGVILCFSDGTNWVAYQVVTKAKGWFANFEDTAFIALGNATAYASSGSINWAAVTRLGYFVHRSGSATTTVNLFCKAFALFGTTAITGGGSSRPASFQDYQSAMNSWGTWLWAELNASSQVKAKSSVQVGDGTNKTYFDGSAQSFEFPQAWSATAITNWQMSWNVASNAVGLSVKAKNADVVNIASGVAATDTLQNLSVNSLSAAAADATYSFAQSFVGWLDPIDNKGLTWAGATFKECGTVTIAGGGDMTNCTIASTTSANAAMAVTANGTTLDGCTIVGTGAAYALELGTSVTAITLTDCTLTAGSTDKVHVLKTTGTVTITISGTTILAAGDVTSAGAMVDIAAPSPTLDATVLANTRAVLWNRTTAAELDNTWLTGTSWSKAITSGASSGDVLDLYAFREGYLEAVATIIYSGVDATFALEQAVDPAIDYYRTTESITDYTTLSEFNFYAPDIYIQSDDADGATSLKRLFIYYNGALTTEDGARYMRGGITFRSAFDVVINRSVVPVAVDNVSATLGLYFTDEATIRVTTDDGTSWIAPPSAPGSIRYAFGVSPGQVETTGSSVITGTAQSIIDAIPSTTDIWNNSKALTVPKFLGLK